MKTRRLIALLLSLVMMLPVFAASAGDEYQSRVAALLAEGKRLESTITLSVNKDMLGGLIASSMEGSDTAEGMEANMAVADTLLSILNKLQIVYVSDKENVSGTVGSTIAPLFKFAGKVDAESGESTLSSDLFPGILLSIPGAPGASDIDLNAFNELDDKFDEAFENFFETEIVPVAEKNEGEFTKEGKTFKESYKFKLTTHLVAKGLNVFTEQIKTNEALKNLFDTVLASSAQVAGEVDEELPEGTAPAGVEMGSAAPKNADELIAMFEGASEGLLAEDAEDVAEVEVLVNDDGSANITLELPEGAGLVNVYISETGDDAVELSVYMILKSGVGVAAEGEEASEKIDWAQLKEDIFAGKDYSNTYVQADIVAKADEGANKANAALKLNAVSSGMSVGFSVESEENLTGAYEGTANIEISLFSPEPVVSINVKTVETENAVESLGEGEKVVFTPDADDEAMEPLATAFMGNAPVLLENLSKAFPDEAGAINQMLEQMGPGAETQAN
ncbi:MAG TPA: hypothetical protein GXZ91_07165 [Christensenellaceae bacterium]|jgi:hypothetical protein|nr:hypothetical protein [Christensenellaceae bacterium]